jgi:hypothetical protein
MPCGGLNAVCRYNIYQCIKGEESAYSFAFSFPPDIIGVPGNRLSATLCFAFFFSQT